MLLINFDLFVAYRIFILGKNNWKKGFEVDRKRRLRDN
jgi:hypothetical protein